MLVSGLAIGPGLHGDLLVSGLAIGSGLVGLGGGGRVDAQLAELAGLAVVSPSTCKLY